MSRMQNIHDDEIKRRLRREQTDPISMCIVIRKKPDFDVTQIAHQVINAVREAAGVFSKDENFKDRYQTWLDGSFRKICLKARPGQFEQLSEMNPTVHVGDVIICPPQYESDRWPVLDKLQVLQNLEGDFSHLGPHIGDFLINDSLNMSHGKILAQLGHAALLAGDVDVNHVGYMDYGAWEIAAKEFDVICTKDGGITEVAAGSETIMSIVRYAD